MLVKRITVLDGWIIFKPVLASLLSTQTYIILTLKCSKNIVHGIKTEHTKFNKMTKDRH